MFKLLNICGYYEAIQSARLSKKSGDKSDSIPQQSIAHRPMTEGAYQISIDTNLILGPKDIELVSGLVSAGDEHAKSLRGVLAWIEITLPRYAHVDFDTYSVGATRIGSESTNHMIMKEEVTADNFIESPATNKDYAEVFIERLIDIKEAIKTERQEDENDLTDDELFLEVKASLPEGFLQKRVWVISYQALRRIYFQRRNHKLPVLREFCSFIETLPLAKEWICVPSHMEKKYETLKKEYEAFKTEHITMLKETNSVIDSISTRLDSILNFCGEIEASVEATDK